jgi:hypothetical protein
LSPQDFNDDPEPRADLFTMSDLVLLHHWSVRTSLTIVDTPGVNHIWQTTMVQIGTKHPYVMHGIFSLTALHMAYLEPQNKHALIATAAEHHNRALRVFQTKIADIKDYESDALFASASINIMYVFAAYGQLYHGETDQLSAANRSHILGEDWIPLIRGVKGLTEQIRARVSVGPLSSLLYLGNWEELDPDTVSVAHGAELQSLQSIWKDDADAPLYNKVLYVLRKCWAWITQLRNTPEHVLAHFASNPHWAYNRGWSAPFIWLSLAPDAYFLCLQQRRPEAVLLFVHFGGLSAELRGCWWMEGWGKNIVAAATDTLGTYWDNWLQLPWRLVSGL